MAQGHMHTLLAIEQRQETHLYDILASMLVCTTHSRHLALDAYGCSIRSELKRWSRDCC